MKSATEAALVAYLRDQVLRYDADVQVYRWMTGRAVSADQVESRRPPRREARRARKRRLRGRA